MDGNKDAAQKCFEIGNQALKEGDKLRAYRFLSKAQRLDPSLALENLLSSLAEERNGQDGDSTQEAAAPKESVDEQQASSSGVRTGSCNGNGLHKPAPEYTTEQIDIVRRIRKTRDYYQILGLEKECTAEEIRKAYRKVSLKVHPDKNKAPGADEAFKAVSRAFACLNEPELRQKYDQYGPEEANDVAAQQRGPFQHHRNGFVYGDMFDANEIFNSFFYGTSNGFQRAQFVRTHGAGGRQRVHTREVHVGSMLNLLHLLPILALFILSYLPFSSKPVYSLEQGAPYEIQYLTKVNMVPFFVKSVDFDKDYPSGSQSRKNLETQIEREFREVLHYYCRQELGWKRWDPSTKTPHCDRLQQFKAY